jgi:predicted kinase
MKQNLPLIIVDNTNIKLWEMRKYVEMAQRYGYSVEIQTSDTDWAWNARQCAKKNSHGVPEDKIQQMIDNFEKFESLEDILHAEMTYRKKN